MKNRFITGFFALTAIVVLIIDTKTAITGAQDGVQLCLTTVIPSLLPFFVLTILTTASLVGTKSKILRPLEKVCKMNKGSGVLLVTGLIGGYPTGAQCVADAYKEGAISRENAIRLLSFCSNAGPAYIFGILSSQFTCSAAPWLLWGIHILSCLAVATMIPGNYTDEQVTITHQKMNLMDAVNKAGRNIAKVCVWVIIFRVIVAFLDRWILWYFDPSASVLICGILELTIGGTELICISAEGLRFVICSVLLGFGGICVVLQTSAVIGNLPISAYIKGKIMQAFFSLIFSVAVQFYLMSGTDQMHIGPQFIIILTATAAIFLFFSLKNKIKYSNIRLSGV